MRLRHVIALTALIAAAVSAPAATVTDLPIGSPTPAFSLQTTDGEEISLLDEYGRPIVIVFADLTQENSQRAISELQSIWDSAPGADEILVLVIVESIPEGEEPDLPFPILLDTDRTTFAEHGVISVLPCVLFLDDAGLLHWVIASHGVTFEDTVADEIAFLTGQITLEDLERRREGPPPMNAALMDFQRRVNLADQMRQRGLYEMAGREYEAILEEAPLTLGAHLGLAQIALRMESLDVAESHARSALATDPAQPLALKILAHTLLLQGDLDGAEDTLGQFIEIAGVDVETDYLLGRLEEARGREEQALSHYRQACESLLADRRWGLFTEP
jgi:tetratricopeptide (TPR) repeat protein